MRQREQKINSSLHQEEQSPVAPVSGESREETLAAAERFLAAGDEAIRRALSGSSEDFLASNRQEGGQ